jgi:hypothetical protein
MNERIKQLLNQAGIYQPDRFDAIDGSNQMEKFAELIVRECIGIVKQRWINPDEDVIAEEIKQHFGVEE